MLLSGDSSPDDTVLRILKLEGTLEKITKPPSGGPYAPTKVCERTVSQRDQELGLRHHGSRYPDNPELLGQATHYPYSCSSPKLQKSTDTGRVSYKDTHPGKKDMEWAGRQGNDTVTAHGTPCPAMSPLTETSADLVSKS